MRATGLYPLRKHFKLGTKARTPVTILVLFMSTQKGNKVAILSRWMWLSAWQMPEAWACGSALKHWSSMLSPPPLQEGQPVYRLKGQHRTLEDLEEAEGEARQEENLRIKICYQ